MACIVGGYFQMQVTWEDLISCGNITPDIRNHLQRVYLSLFLILLSLVVGFYVEFLFKFGGLVSVVVCLGILESFLFIKPHREITRVCLLIGAAFFLGASIGYLVDMKPINLSFVITALVVIACTCCSFTVAAVIEEDRGFIYCGGIGSSIAPMMLVPVVALKYFKLVIEPPTLPHPYSLLWVCFIVYLWFLVYLLTYSQEVVVRHRSKNYSIWQHAVRFFTHMPAVHVYTIFIVLREAYGRIRLQPQQELEGQLLQQEPEVQPVQPELEMQPLQ